MGCVTPPWLMTSCLLAEAVPNTVTSLTVLHNWVAAMPTPPREETKLIMKREEPWTQRIFHLKTRTEPHKQRALQDKTQCCHMTLKMSTHPHMNKHLDLCRGPLSWVNLQRQITLINLLMDFLMFFFCWGSQINLRETQAHEHESLMVLNTVVYENGLLRTQSATVTTEKQQQQTSLSHFKA